MLHRSTCVCLAAALALGLGSPVWAQPAAPQGSAKPTSSPSPSAAPSAAAPQPSVAPSAAPSAAAPKPSAPPAAGGDDGPKVITEETKAESRRHFQRGLELLKEQAWAPALAEFLLSRQLYPTRVATNNAAFALRKLERYDEALDMYETLLRDFEVAQAEREAAQAQLAELRGLVATIDVSGAVPGASIAISSQDRGEFPPIKPLRVAAGSHVVRVFKEGYEPFETRVNVAGGETARITAKMAKLTDSGRLRVVEQSGKAIDVVVDNVTVGRTPWEGILGVGPHMVLLRGTGKVGTQPTNAPVKSGELTTLRLVAEDLDASLRVTPTPPGANVWVNGVNVGRGLWLGRLKAGPQKVEVKAEGFLDASRDVTLQKGQREVVDLVLERDEEAPMWRVPAKWTVDLATSLLIAPTFGGDVAGNCSGGCSRSVGLGVLAMLHGSYELGSGVGFGLEAGYLYAGQSLSGRDATIQPHGLSTPTPGLVDDSLRYQGFVGGAALGYHLSGDYPVTLRVGTGVVVGQLRDERNGVFQAQHGGSFSAYPVADFEWGTYYYVDPAIRAGFRFADNFELAASVQALMLIGISTPRWNKSLELAAGSDGVGSYADDQLMGGFVFMIAPGLDLRYDF